MHGAERGASLWGLAEEVFGKHKQSKTKGTIIKVTPKKKTEGSVVTVSTTGSSIQEKREKWQWKGRLAKWKVAPWHAAWEEVGVRALDDDHLHESRRDGVAEPGDDAVVDLQPLGVMPHRLGIDGAVDMIGDPEFAEGGVEDGRPDLEVGVAVVQHDGNVTTDHYHRFNI